LSHAEDCLIENVTVLGYKIAAFEFTKNCRQISVVQCIADAPQSDVDKGGGYGFRTKGAQLVLFDRCESIGARYSYVCAGGAADSGIVFRKCSSINAHIAGFICTGRWSHGILLDNFYDKSPAVVYGIVLGNCGNGSVLEGTGWTCVQSVAWRCDIGDEKMLLQKPPLGNNYAIACIGVIDVEGLCEPRPGKVLALTGNSDAFESLFDTQLKARHGNTKQE
jgi:hypothetical protein